MVTLRSLIGTFASLSLLLALALSPAFAQPVFDAPGLERAIEAQERHTNDLLGIQGVVGTAVGLGANGQAVVKIYTERSGVAGLPRSLDGVPVRVQVTGRIFALDKPIGGFHDHGNGEEDPTDGCTSTTGRFRPACIGISTGHPNITAGTIGARVMDGTNVYALSNNHVYADENIASIGDNVLQPGTYDGGDPNVDDDVIGTLAAFVEILFIDGDVIPENKVDAAIALSSTVDLDKATPPDGYGTPKSAPALLVENDMPVQKYGRTTSLTKGTIKGINVTINVGYDKGVARFVGQIEVRSNKGPFIKGGDSGSLLVTDPDRNPVGLLFAGNLNGKTAFANPIGAVLEAFGVTIDGE